MARNSRYCAPFRRRREKKTDYGTRKAFLMSGKPRLVARSSIANMSVQIVAARPFGDEVLVSASSRELIGKFGWKSPCGNLPAAYLTGYLCGMKAKSRGVREAIFDIGLNPPTKGARIFATLKGVLDAGLEVPHSNEKLPDAKRIDGTHIAEYARSLASNFEVYQQKFSKYLAKKVPPETLPDHVEVVKKTISDAFKVEVTNANVKQR